MKLGLVRLLKWTNNTNRLLELPQKYCSDRILREIVGAIGTSLVITLLPKIKSLVTTRGC